MRTFVKPSHRPIGNKGNGYNFIARPGWRPPIRCQDHRCIECRRQFWTDHPTQRWCSRECWLAALRAHLSPLPLCPICGTKFMARLTPRGPKRHCSRTCWGLSHRGAQHHRWRNGRYAKSIPDQVGIHHQESPPSTEVPMGRDQDVPSRDRGRETANTKDLENVRQIGQTRKTMTLVED